MQKGTRGSLEEIVARLADEHTQLGSLVDLFHAVRAAFAEGGADGLAALMGGESGDTVRACIPAAADALEKAPGALPVLMTLAMLRLVDSERNTVNAAARLPASAAAFVGSAMGSLLFHDFVAWRRANPGQNASPRPGWCARAPEATNPRPTTCVAGVTV